MARRALPRRAVPAPPTARADSCTCGRPVFLRNGKGVACHRPLGAEAPRGRLLDEGELGACRVVQAAGAA